MIVAPSADLDLAVRAIVFAAVGTAGQRCTTLRRLIVAATASTSRCLPRLRQVYAQVERRQPARRRHAGRPADRRAGRSTGMQAALDARPAPAARWVQRRRARSCSGSIPTPSTCARRWWRCRTQTDIVLRGDVRADPLRHAATTTLDEAIALHNAVPHGLSSSIFTNDLREAELFSAARRAPTAASPTSTSAPRAPRSAAPSAARRTPAAAASPAPTPGRPTCAARPTPSTTRASCRWRRASGSRSGSAALP